MKKYLLVMFGALLLFVVTGCESKNTVVCTGKVDDHEAELTAEFDSNDKLTTITVVEEAASKEEADQVCALSSVFEAQGISVSCSGTKVTIKGYEKMVDSEEDEEKMVGLSKEEFKKAIEKESDGTVTCK